MARLPVTFADEAPPRSRWPNTRVFAWTLLFTAMCVWVATALVH